MASHIHNAWQDGTWRAVGTAALVSAALLLWPGTSPQEPLGAYASPVTVSAGRSVAAPALGRSAHRPPATPAVQAIPQGTVLPEAAEATPVCR